MSLEINIIYNRIMNNIKEYDEMFNYKIDCLISRVINIKEINKSKTKSLRKRSGYLFVD